MQGHLRERKPGVWELIVPLGRDPLTGRKRQRSRTVRGTKREAQRALRRLCSDVDDGRLTGTAVTVSDLLARWLEHAEHDLSPTTLREYRRLIARRIEPALGPVPLVKLTAAHLDDLYRALGTDAGLAPASVRQVHSIVRRALRQAVKWGWLAHNPAVNATPPRVRHREVAPPGVDELRVLLAAADAHDPTIGVLVRVAAATGLRRGELCGLRWPDLDLGRRRLIVRRAVAAVPGGTVEKDTKSTASRRLALDPATVDVLVAHLARCESLAAECGVTLGPDAFVFSRHPDGSAPPHPDNVTAAFRRLPVNRGRYRLHDLRHAHATELLARGVPVRTVSGRLGHTTASTTLNIYAHVVEETDEVAAQAIGGLLADP